MKSTWRKSPIRIPIIDGRRAGVGSALALAAALLLLTAPTAHGQLRVDGQVYAMAYAWDAPADGGGRVDAYQGLQVRVRPSDMLDVRTHLRFAQFGNSGGSDVRVYQLYGDARLDGRNLVARLGRQFVYRGAINGTFDAASIRYQSGGWDVQALAGSAVPYDRAAELQSWDDGGSMGLYVGKAVGDGVRANVSYFNRRRSAQTAWSIAGAALSFRLNRDAFVQTELDYNLEQESVQRFRARAWYEAGKWIFSGEAGVQKPQIYEDSFFSIFELEGYNQARFGVSYAIGTYRIGYQFIGTSFDVEDGSDDSSTSAESIVSLSSGWGTLGVVHQGGFGGDRLGLYADARFDLTDHLGLTVRASRLEYQRRSTALDEDATAFSAGFDVRPTPKLRLHVQAQQSYNRMYDQDLRLLVRAGYSL